MKNKSLSIILCTLNEEAHIAETINKLNNTFDDIEIIIVDDDSSDKTVSKIQKLNFNNIRIIQRKKNRGLASAFMVGLMHSTGDVVGWIDTNMPYIIDEYKKMLLEIGSADVALLSRYVRNAKDDRKILRKISSKILNLFAKFLLNSKINDLSSGLFIMKRNILNEVIPIAYGHGEFMIEFLVDLEKKGFKIKEFYYTQLPENQSSSKTISSFYNFCRFGFYYFLRIFKLFLKKR